MKLCPHCKQTLPLADFRTVRGDKASWICNPCERVYHRRKAREYAGLPLDRELRKGPAPKAPVGDDWLRGCKDCGQRLPLKSFGSWEWKGHTYYRAHCHPCHLKRREKSDAVWRAKRRVEIEKSGVRGCTRCHQMLPLAAFDKIIDPRDGVLWYSPRCRECDPPEGFKQCSECSRQLPVNMFGQFYDAQLGRHRRRARCTSCWSQKNVAERSAKRAAAAGSPKPRALRVNHVVGTYPCANACGAMVVDPEGTCRDCKKAKFNDNHARTAAEMIGKSTKRVLKKYAQGLIKGVLWISAGEVWTADAECGMCHKPIMATPWGAPRCYTCGTGQPRTILRRDERAAAAA